MATKQSFPTSGGTVEVVVHEASRIVSIARLNAEGRPVASTMCDWNTADLADVLKDMNVSSADAREIAEQVKVKRRGFSVAPPPPVMQPTYTMAAQSRKTLQSAGIALRFVAVLLDSIIVFFPLGFVVGLMTGEGYGGAQPRLCERRRVAQYGRDALPPLPRSLLLRPH